MEITLKKIAEIIDGRLEGDSLKIIKGVAAFDEAANDDITFAENKKILKMLDNKTIGAAVVPEDYRGGLKNFIAVKNTRLSFIKIIRLFHPVVKPDFEIGKFARIDETAMLDSKVYISDFTFIGKNAVIGERVFIHPHVYIGNNVTIGDDTEIFPNVSICDGCRIGKRVIIQAGSVIGSDGFGYVYDGEKHNKIPHIGIVRIDDDVEIGAGNTIDRGTIADTWIKKGVKTDNLVHIAHNVIVGENTLLIAQSGIAGSAVIGRNVIVAGQAGIAGKLKIEDGAIVGPGAGVTKNVKSGEIVSGIPEMPHRQWLKVHAILKNLPELKKRIEKLEKKNV